MRRINLIVITLFFIISFYFFITLFITSKTTDYNKNLTEEKTKSQAIKARYVRDVDIDNNVQSSSEFSWITNFAGYKLTRDCEKKKEIEEFAKGLNQIKFHEKVIYVVVENELKDNLRYLVNSFNEYTYPFVILGMGQKLEGYAARILKLRDFLRDLLKDSEKYGLKKDLLGEMLVVYCNVESLAVNYPYELSTKYNELFQNSIVFMANKKCQPERDFWNDFPQSQTFLRYLNHRLFMGPVQKVSALFEEYPIPNNDYDEQLYFIEAFLSNLFNMKIDYKKNLFAPLSGFSHFNDHYKVDEESVRNKLISSVLVDNLQRRTYPFIVNANGKLGGHSRPNLKMLQNLFPSTKTNRAPYLLPPPLASNKSFIESKTILMALYLHDDFPFFDDYMENLENLDFKKENIVLYINYYHEGDGRKNILDKIESLKEANLYKDVVVKDIYPLKIAKRTALYATNEYECDYYFTTDSIISNRNTLNSLIAEDKPIVTPLLTKHGQLFSNFWGDVTHDSGNYKDYPLYNDIITKKKVGIFGGTVTWGTYLIKASEISERFGPCYQPIRKIDRLPPFSSLCVKEKEEDWYVDILFSLKASIYSPVFVTNREKYGDLIEKDIAKTSAKEVVDLFLYDENEYFWRKKYFSKQFFEIANGKKKVKFEINPSSLDKQCRHYSWKFFKKKFCQDLLQVINTNYDDFLGIWKSFDSLISDIVPGYTIKETYILFFHSNYTLEVDEGVSVFMFPLSPSVDQNGCTLSESFGYYYERPKQIAFDGHRNKKHLFVIEFQPQ